MNSTQNKKIRQVTEKTMIVGIDVGSVKHYFRAFDSLPETFQGQVLF